MPRRRSDRLRITLQEVNTSPMRRTEIIQTLNEVDGFSASVFLQDVQTKHAVLNINKSLSFKSKETDKKEEVAGGGFRDSSPLFVPSQEDEDIKDKPSLQTTYDGFTIYGKALWLVVTPTASDGAADSARELLLDDWITMSQQQGIAARQE